MKQTHLIIAVGLVALIAGVVFSGVLSRPQEIQSLYYDNPRQIETFSLTADDGQAFDNASLNDAWTLVFLGYTFCPDVCPTTLARLNNVQPKLQALTQTPVKVGLVSVDPNRDDTARLHEYIGFFNNSSFFAATGEHPALFPFTRNLGLVYALSDDTSKENYLVDHSASVVLINPKGNIQAVFKPEYAPGNLPIINTEIVLADFEEIVRRYK